MKGLRHLNLANEQLQRGAYLTDKELPAAMGKLISTLNLQSSFQSLGRYVRSFADAAFVVRGLKTLLIERTAAHRILVDAVIVCCAEYAKLIASLQAINQLTGVIRYLRLKGNRQKQKFLLNFPESTLFKR